MCLPSTLHETTEGTVVLTTSPLTTMCFYVGQLGLVAGPTAFCVTAILISVHHRSMPRFYRSSQSSRGRGRASSRRRGASKQRPPASSASACSYSSNVRPAIHGQSEPSPRTPSINPRSLVAASTVSHAATPAPIQANAPAQSEYDDEILEHVIVAVDVNGKDHIGCAYYVAREKRLFCMEGVDKGGVESVERCESQTALNLLDC